METNVTFRNMEPTDALKSHAEEKVDKLLKYTSKPISVHVILKTEQHKNHTAEIVLQADHVRYTSTDTCNDMYASIDGAIHKLESQLRKHKEKMKKHIGGAKFSEE